MEQLRLELKNKLSEEQFKLFQPQHLQGMVDEAYSAAVLPSASREGLSKAGLPAALVDVLLHAYNGALCMAVVCTQGECNILCLAASVSGTFVKIVQLGTHHSNNSSLLVSTPA
jgi:hypothetical protein